MPYHKCRSCSNYARLNEKSRCASCNKYNVIFRIYNPMTDTISNIDKYDMFRKDFDKRFKEIRKYINFEISYATIHRTKSIIKQDNTGQITLEIDEREYQSMNMRNNLDIAVEGLKNNIDQYLKGNKKYD